MINRIFQKDIKIQTAKLILAIWVFLFVLQPTAVFFGACLIAECRTSTSTDILFSNVLCSTGQHAMNCCRNHFAENIKIAKSKTDQCSNCDCSLTAPLDDQGLIALASSVSVQSLFTYQCTETFHEAVGLRNGRPFLDMFQSQIQFNPIFLINSSFLI